jgi:hypothetical protein
MALSFKGQDNWINAGGINTGGLVLQRPVGSANFIGDVRLSPLMIQAGCCRLFCFSIAPLNQLYNAMF